MSKLIGDQVSDLSVFSKKSTVKSTFSKNLIGDTKRILPVNEISPDRIIMAASRKRHQQAIGVKNNVHYWLYGVRMCSFFQPSMTSSLRIPSSHRRSIASSARLAKYCPSIRRISLISRSEFTFAVISSISIWNGVNGVACKIVVSISFLHFLACKFTVFY